MWLRVAVVAAAACVAVTALVAPVRAAAESCQYVLGFRVLYDALPATVGACQDNQAFVANGDALQHADGGLLAWRKADNWTAFTNGYRTWVNGPNGIQQRLNTDRFPWEHDVLAFNVYFIALGDNA